MDEHTERALRDDPLGWLKAEIMLVMGPVGQYSAEPVSVYMVLADILERSEAVLTSTDQKRDTANPDGADHKG